MISSVVCRAEQKGRSISKASSEVLDLCTASQDLGWIMFNLVQFEGFQHTGLSMKPAKRQLAQARCGGRHSANAHACQLRCVQSGTRPGAWDPETSHTCISCRALMEVCQQQMLHMGTETALCS